MPRFNLLMCGCFMVPLLHDKNIIKCNITCRDCSDSGSACFFVLWRNVPETKFQPCSGTDTTLKYFQVGLVVLVRVDQIIMSQQSLLQEIQKNNHNGSLHLQWQQLLLKQRKSLELYMLDTWWCPNPDKHLGRGGS